VPTTKSSEELVREYENHFRSEALQSRHELRPQKQKPDHLEEIPQGPLADGMFSNHYSNPSQKSVP